ncbi:MAG: amidohydrolase family protein [Sphingomonadaceae bacterium]
MRILLVVALFLAAPAHAATERFSILFQAVKAGFLEATTEGDTVRITYDFKNNGRGPTIAETLTIGADGLPRQWAIDGSTTFGNRVAERLDIAGGIARWTDSTGSAESPKPALYIAQDGSPWALGLYARAALARGGSIAALPTGTLLAERGPSLAVTGQSGPLQVTRVTLTGIDLNPTTILLDPDDALFALVTPRFLMVREGFEGEAERLQGLASEWTAERLNRIARQVARRPDRPIRFTNVRIFEAATGTLSGPAAVVVEGNRIARIEAATTRPRAREVVIDGEGGTLIPGLFEMHGHIGDTTALMNIAAGVTSVRDMGNDNDVLARLIDGIAAGELVGPRILRSGFIEGKSPFSALNGIVVDSEERAVEAVRHYAARGFWQIKIYNSIDPAWVPAMVAEAHRLGLRVSGHVPAFTTADAMLEAGYDELTHSNQLMLNWVLKPGDDTRTLLRLTALKRLADFDLSGPAPQRTLALMESRKVVHDPTLTILEALMLNRNGEIPPGAADWFDHLPPGAQRSQKRALADIADAQDDAAYRGAWETTLAVMRELHRRGTLIVPGTDYGGGLWLHRELELYTRFGMTPAEVLTRATRDMARYTGQEDLGEIAPGKLADFFLIAGNPLEDLSATKFTRAVVKDGTLYFPDEIYPFFGMRPLAARPPVAVPRGASF